jgi:hypothetical protein
MWGSLDVGYAVRRLLSRNMEKSYLSHSVTSSKHSGHFSHLNGGSNIEPKEMAELRSTHYQPSWTSQVPWRAPTTAPLMQESFINFVEASEKFKEMASTKLFGVVNLLIRLFQAHIMMGWLFIFLAIVPFFPIPTDIQPHHTVPRSPRLASSQQSSSIIHILIHADSWIVFFVTFCTFVRVFSAPLMVATFVLYYKFHQAAIHRWTKVGRRKLGLRPHAVSTRQMPWAVLDLLAIPGCIIFAILPLFHAQCSHIFTSWLVYTVSRKPPQSSLKNKADPSWRC